MRQITKRRKIKVKMILPGGEATPAPPVGTTFGQYGLRVMEFCKRFNEATKDRMGQPVPVEIEIDTINRDFKFIVKKAPTSYLIKRAASIIKGSPDPSKKKVGIINEKQLREIAKYKLDQFNTDDVDKAMKIVEGTAKAMGVLISKK